jgi:hypothetical protein
VVVVDRFEVVEVDQHQRDAVTAAACARDGAFDDPVRESGQRVLQRQPPQFAFLYQQQLVRSFEFMGTFGDAVLQFLLGLAQVFKKLRVRMQGGGCHTTGPAQLPVPCES